MRQRHITMGLMMLFILLSMGDFLSTFFAMERWGFLVIEANPIMREIYQYGGIDAVAVYKFLWMIGVIAAFRWRLLRPAAPYVFGIIDFLLAMTILHNLIQ